MDGHLDETMIGTSGGQYGMNDKCKLCFAVGKIRSVSEAQSVQHCTKRYRLMASQEFHSMNSARAPAAAETKSLGRSGGSRLDGWIAR